MKKVLLVFSLVLLSLGGCSSKEKEATNNKGNEAESSKVSTDQAAKETSESISGAENYDSLVQEAKELNIEGKYKESELKLASIPVTLLGKKEYGVLKEAVEKLSTSNNKGLQEQKEGQKESQTATGSPNNNNNSSSFVGDLAKWANTYVLYYAQEGQKQSRLTIAGNGGVTQSNYDGTQYFGSASISPESLSVLSYTTDNLYPMSMPETKSINSNVKIIVQWDNGGGSQTFYGYLSNSTRLALTDGLSQNGGVHEVWVTY